MKAARIRDATDHYIMSTETFLILINLRYIGLLVTINNCANFSCAYFIALITVSRKFISQPSFKQSTQEVVLKASSDIRKGCSSHTF